MTYFTTSQVHTLQKSKDQQTFLSNLQQMGYKSASIRMLVKNTYSFSTINQMSIEQKESLLNLILQLIYQIPQLQTSKSQYLTNYSNKFTQLTKRSSNLLYSRFSYGQTIKIKKFFEEQVLPYYALYQFVLDSNPQFNFYCDQFDPIPAVSQPQIFEGQVVQVQNIQILKAFVGERQPKQQKKDPKKK